MSSKSNNKHLKIVSNNGNTVYGYKEKFESERNPSPIKPKNEHQSQYLKCLKSSNQIIVMGPAGTGKSYLAAIHASDELRSGKIKKIILTRPNISGSKSIGFLPGTLEEKIAPWAVPVTDTIQERIGKGAYETAIKHNNIQIIPFELLRGYTFKDAVVILDEAQNVNKSEMIMFTTRIGENCQVIINGDISQCDLKESSGLSMLIHLAKKHMLDVPIIEFDLDDIVRSSICSQWVKIFAMEKL